MKSDPGFVDLLMGVVITALVCVVVAYLFFLAGHRFYNVMTVAWFIDTMLIAAIMQGTNDDKSSVVVVGKMFLFLFAVVPICVALVQYTGWGYIWRPFM